MSKLPKLKLHFPTSFYSAHNEISNGNLEAAIIELDKAIIQFDHDDNFEIHPSDTNLSIVYHERANCKFKLERFDETIIDCNKAIELDKTKTESYLMRAFANSNLGKNIEAISDFDRVIALDPETDPAIYFDRGLLFYTLGRFIEAIVSFDKTIALRPDYAYAIHNRGNAKFNLWRFEEAILDYTLALAIDSSLVFSLNNRATCYEKLSKYSLAIADFDASLALNSNDVDIREFRDLIRLELEN